MTSVQKNDLQRASELLSNLLRQTSEPQPFVAPPTAEILARLAGAQNASK